MKNELATLKSTQEYYMRAKEMLSEGRAKPAMPLLDKVLVECTACISFKLEQARALLTLKRYTEASSAALGVLRANSHHAEALSIRGEALYYSSTDLEQPMKHFRQALQSDPDNTHARKMFKQVKEIEQLKSEGNEAFKRGKCDAAVGFYKQAMEVDPDHSLMVATLFSNMAAAHMKQRKWAPALDECNQALQTMPNNQKALLRRAQCLTELEQFQEAVHDYERLKELDQGNSTTPP